MDFWQVIEILGKRKWLIILSAMAAVALTYGATRLMGARWVATVPFVSPDTIAMPTGDSTDSSDGQAAPEPGGAKQNAVYSAMIKSQSVIQPVVSQLGPDAPTTASILDNIDFESSGPHLYELHVTDKNPTRAQQLANGIADRFVDLVATMRTKQAQDGIDYLEKQVKEVDGKLSVARARLSSYGFQHNIIGNDVKTDIETAYAALKIADNKRKEVKASVAQARAQLLTAQADLAKIPRLTPMDIQNTSGVLSQQLAELQKEQEQLDTLRKTLRDDHPRVVAQQTAVNALSARISKEWPQVSNSDTLNPALATANLQIRTLKSEINGGVAQIAELDSQVSQAEAQIAHYKGNDTPLADLSQQVAQYQNDQTSLAERLKRARVALDAVSRQGTITILTRVSDFNPPINATRGRNIKFMIIAALCAAMCMSGLILALNSVDRRVKNIREAEIAIPARLLASIPQPPPAITASNMARVTELQPQSIHSEAYRFLGLHLLNAPSPSIRSLMVLAAKAEQGSTTTLTNLGITLAQAGKRVILVDANIRTPEIHQVFEVDNDFGFTNLLQRPDEASLARAIQPTSNPNLHFITSGPAPANAWQLFRSQNLFELSWLLHDRADFILYDTPSSLMFTDALNMAPIVDAAILCVRALEPLTGTEERLIEMLEDANVSVLGSVLSDVPSAVLEGYRNYQQHYKPLQAPNEERPEFMNLNNGGNGSLPYNGGSNGNGNGRGLVPSRTIITDENVTLRLNVKALNMKPEALRAKTKNGHSS